MKQCTKCQWEGKEELKTMTSDPCDYTQEYCPKCRRKEFIINKVMNKEIIKPKIPNLKKEYLLMIKKAILEDNNLKVGDTILWEFDYDTVRSGYRRGEMNKYRCKKLCEGVLKEDENGILYAESIEDLDFYVSEYRNPIGFKGHYYKRKKKKSIHYFGEGFIYNPKKN